MKRTLILATALACAVPLTPASGPYAQSEGGALVGTVRGPSRPLAAMRVQIVNASGEIVASTTTDAEGRFTIGGLRAGTCTVQLLGSTGHVIAATAAALTDGVKTEVTLHATAAALASAAAAATTAEPATDAVAARAPAGRRTISARKALLAVGAAAAGAMIVGFIPTGDEASGRQ